MNETSELTPEERLDAVAKILAQAILRLQNSRRESPAEPQAADANLVSDSTQTVEKGKPSRNPKVSQIDRLIAGLAPLLKRDTPSTVTPQAPPTVRSSTECDIGQEVKLLEAMTINELRAKYTDVTGERTRNKNRRFLIRRIAWHLQANAFGGLSEKAGQRAAELLQESIEHAKVANEPNERQDTPKTPKERTPRPKKRLHSANMACRRSDSTDDDRFSFHRNLPPPP